MKLDSSRFEQRMAQLITTLEEAAIASTTAAVPAVQAQIVALTPTKDEEYNSIMYGEGGGGDVSLAGDRSADPDGRIRFQKNPGTWLSDMAVSSVNVKVSINGSQTLVALGNMSLLNTGSTFRYTNLEDHTHMPIEHQAGPYFDFFENGASYVVVPTHKTRKDYPLRPHGDPKEDEGRYEFPKSISAHRAYLPEVLFPVFRESVIATLSETDFNKS